MEGFWVPKGGSKTLTVPSVFGLEIGLHLEGRFCRSKTPQEVPKSTPRPPQDAIWGSFFAVLAVKLGQECTPKRLPRGSKTFPRSPCRGGSAPPDPPVLCIDCLAFEPRQSLYSSLSLSYVFLLSSVWPGGLRPPGPPRLVPQLFCPSQKTFVQKAPRDLHKMPSAKCAPKSNR